MEGGRRSWSTSYNWQERASELSSKWKVGNGACWFSMGCFFCRLRRRLREVASIKSHDLLHSSPSWPVSWSEIHPGVSIQSIYPGVSIQSHMISNHCKWSWHSTSLNLFSPICFRLGPVFFFLFFLKYNLILKEKGMRMTVTSKVLPLTIVMWLAVLYLELNKETTMFPNKYATFIPKSIPLFQHPKDQAKVLLCTDITGQLPMI